MALKAGAVALGLRWGWKRLWLGNGVSYWLTRFVILRFLGLIYFFAFLILIRQGLPLLGHRGLTPADQYLARVGASFPSRGEAVANVPTLFWLNCSDAAFLNLAWAGLIISAVVMFGYANAILMFLLWLIYLSYVHIGQRWYGYGWEIQLLETGFIAMFLCPLIDGRPFPRRPAPVIVMWLFRWLTFRIMLGAGMIKMRGDSCWRDLTCLYYHYETQPIPNPLSPTLHFMPHWFHKFGVLWNHFIELAVPWFGFGPRSFRHVAGVLLGSFQVILILSGNLAFLNWLTIVPILACFDDSILGKGLPRRLVERARRAAELQESSPAHVTAATFYGLVVAILSLWPIENLLSRRQMMNTSFDRLHLVNTYGAFGSVGRERSEIIFEGTRDERITPQTQWRAYEFHCKPGDIHRRPCILGPYHHRLDWQIWFAAMSSPEQEPWTLHFVWKLLHNDSGTLSLLANNPFPEGSPRFIRAQLYHYEFARPGNPKGDWWKREFTESWLPPLSADDPRFLDILARYGWGPAAERTITSPESR